MGRRDYRHREPKKPKKGGKKPVVSILPTVGAVEVIKKGKRPRELGEEAEGG